MMEQFIFKAIIATPEIYDLSKIPWKTKVVGKLSKSGIESISIVVHFNCILKVDEQISI